ncbi:MAG: hypothetical protein WCI11_18305 [Candidatus Methylumidiphilus sp.]
MDVNKPWERRLKDLAHLLTCCASSYFDPDLFRMNLNQFLQTSRTVTFIIQKNKSNIPHFKEWYDKNVLTKWKNDTVMQWAKDSRNKIEKEGDLDLYSSLRVTLVFSYLNEEDVALDLGCNELLNAGVKKLIRLARRKLPSSVSDAAAIRIERRWVTASLSSYELLYSLNYIYMRVYECCQSLAAHLNSLIDNKILVSSEATFLREETRKVAYVKLRGMESHIVTSRDILMEPTCKPPEDFCARLIDSEFNRRPPTSLKETVQLFSHIAKNTFEYYGNHKSMLFFFDHQWKILDMLTTQFEDQTDKFIFWRFIAERIACEKIHGLIWISEAWIRDCNNDFLPIRNMPIVGERLHVRGIDRDNNRAYTFWNVMRNGDNTLPTLQLIPNENFSEYEKFEFLLIPAMRAMELPDPPYLSASRSTR